MSIIFNTQTTETKVIKMNLNYKTIDNLDLSYDELTDWCSPKETSAVVGLAIHAISDKSRSPDEIWASPTEAEYDHVLMAVENYINAGFFEPAPEYYWGMEKFSI